MNSQQTCQEALLESIQNHVVANIIRLLSKANLLREGVSLESVIEALNHQIVIVDKLPMSVSSEDIWTHIINTNCIDLNKYVSILTSKDIKKCNETWTGKKSQFEPRLLCKMDCSKSRPKIFIDNNIYILSIKNGTYALIKENIYIPLIKYYYVPNIINKKNNSLILDIGEGETCMLDKMYYNNILDDIIGEKINQGPLLGGRHRCHFNTIIGSEHIEIRGSQYETDGCYESDNYVCIVEAKSIECSDFNIRQLYYPFREVYKKIGDKKKIICLFIYKDKNNIIHIYKFRWNDYNKMLDIQNIGYYQYCFNYK
jgi:hypothetical protein